MAVPTWVPGQILNASDVNSWFVPKVCLKTGDTQRNSTTTMTNDPDLSLTLDTNAVYHLEGAIFYTGGTGASEGDLKFTFANTSMSGSYCVTHNNLSHTFAGAFQNFLGDTVTADTQGVSSIEVLGFQGMITTTSPSPSLTFQWAQNSSNATNTTIKANSFLVARRIG